MGFGFRCEQVANNSLMRPYATNKTNIEVTQKFMSHLSYAPLDEANKKGNVNVWHSLWAWGLATKIHEKTIVYTFSFLSASAVDFF